MQNSKIEWTHHTFNPVIGCTKVSEGCKFCYAEAMMDERYKKAKWGPGQRRVRTSAAYWRAPYKWNKQAEAEGRRMRVFCASLSDVFEDHPDWIEPRVDLFRMIVHTRSLDWLLLTKRPQNVMPMLEQMGWSSLMDNVWIGTSVENQAAADERLPHLLKIPVKVRFLSMEPLLGPVNIRDFVEDGAGHWRIPTKEKHWVIVGGESGQNARPVNPAWVRSIRDQCQAAGVPVFFKQWGEYIPSSHALPTMPPGAMIWPWANGELGNLSGDTTMMLRVGKKNAGRLLDGVEYSSVPCDQ